MNKLKKWLKGIWLAVLGKINYEYYDTRPYTD
jgi:hypothetical protein